MKILIKSRHAVEKMATTGFEPDTALISIADAGNDFAVLSNKPEYLIQLAFNDMDNTELVDELGRVPTEDERTVLEKKYNMLSDEQAQQIADFYNQICDKAKTIICQCEHGQSRSAAIAAAIMEHRSRQGIKVFAHDSYYPNKTIFKKVLHYLDKKI